jgi:chemotaxis signal transduction protein
MQLLIVQIKNEKYAFKVDNIVEIINRTALTDVPESESYLEGILHHRSEVLPILNFRTILGEKSYKNEQIALLDSVINQHHEWINSFKHSVETGEPFNKALDPHMCNLGKWIDQMLSCLKCNNEGFVNLIKETLLQEHNSLHLDGKKILELSNKEEQLHLTNTKITAHYKAVVAELERLKKELDKLIFSYERVIIYKYKEEKFGLVIDLFDKIIDIDENDLQHINSGSLITNDTITFDSVIHYENTVIMVVDFKDAILEATIPTEV